jgi:hypothetical protein
MASSWFATGRSIQSQQDVWMELFNDELTEALAKLGSRQRDEFEPFDGFAGHWTSDPVGLVLLVRKDGSEPETEKES